MENLEKLKPLVTQIVEQLEDKNNKLGEENLSTDEIQENLYTSLEEQIEKIVETMKNFKVAIENLANNHDNMEGMDRAVYKEYIKAINEGNKLIKDSEYAAARSYLSNHGNSKIEEMKIDTTTAINLYKVRLFVENNSDVEAYVESRQTLEDLEEFVSKNVEDEEKYNDGISKLKSTQTQEGPPQGAPSSQGDTPSEGTSWSTSAEEETQTQEVPPQGAPSSQGDTSSEGTSGSTSAEEETQTQEGPPQGAPSSQGDTPSEGTTGSTSAEEETQTQEGPTSIAPSPEFRKKYRDTLQQINEKVDNLSKAENLIENYLALDNLVDENNKKLIELSESTHDLEMNILMLQRKLINLELNEYKVHPFYYAKTDQNLAPFIKEMNDRLNKLKPENDVADFYVDKVNRINKVINEINSLDANDDRRKTLEELIVAFKRIINHRLMREVHFNQGFQIKQFIEEQEQNNIKIDTINHQQINQPQHSPKKQTKPNVEKFYEFLGEEIIKLYVQNANNQSVDFATFFTRTIASNFDQFLNSMAQIDKDNIVRVNGLDPNGSVKYYWKNSSSKNGIGAEITFTEFAKYFTKSYQKKKTTPEGFTSEFSDISINLNPNKKRIQTVNRANDTIVNVTLSSITQLSDGSIQNDSLISEDVRKINDKQDMIARTIIIKKALKEKLQDQKLSLSLTSDHGASAINTTTNNNDEEYIITQNVSEKDNSKIQIKDENGNIVYVIELSYDIEKTKSKLHM